MRLRLILLVLAFLTFLSTSIGGYLYYANLHASAFKEAERQAKMRLEILSKSVTSYLAENNKVVRILAGQPLLANHLITAEGLPSHAVNTILDQFQGDLEADVCYLINGDGLTVASSNRHDPDSFVGQNFSFRPYFQKAIKGWPTAYLALGTTSQKRGIYNSCPIYKDPAEDPVGVAVIKSSIDVIENRLGLTSEDIVLVTDPRGVIFISNRGDWLFNLAWRPTPGDLDQIAQERQFGTGPWAWVGLEFKDDQRTATLGSERFLMNQVELDTFPGWKIIQLRSYQAISAAISDPFLRVTGPVVLLLCFLIGIAVLLLYQNASKEIARRRVVESALRKSEERYRSLYHRTPAMLHSIDTEGRLVSVSDFWAEALGYQPREVIGQPLTAFMTPESRRVAEKEVFPLFFKTGFCKDVAYQFLTKNNATIDVLLSAIADRDEEGRFARTLAVSIDVTERKRAEEALKHTQEELSRYSKDLERQVNLRTREISSILKHTPAVVYFKDINGRYLLVNFRYEELFNLKDADIRGRTDDEILPVEVADQFREGDRRVLAKNRSYQVEEMIPQADGPHTYLSVKFPVYDEGGGIRGVGGIATDITDLKKAQNQLRRLSGNIMANQEKERAAIARELHDELGQVLTALRLDAVWLQEKLKTGDALIAGRIASMCGIIDQTINDVRTLAFHLRPGVLDDLGLVDALELYTSDFERRTGITCVFEPAAMTTPSDTVATAAYRIAQEALTNVARHAGAGHVHVLMGKEPHRLILAVQDDGRGFDVNHLPEFEGLGLAGMRERAALAGGRLEIQSKAGHGTLVRFMVPLGEEAERDSRKSMASAVSNGTHFHGDA
jgi:PAS domain S-box-containing protein